jgi:hypothetical protein
VLPFLLLLFAKPAVRSDHTNLFASFFRSLSFWAIINNIIGFIQYANYPNDDSFAGIYGHFTVTQNGLAILNSFLFFYYFKKYQIEKKRNDLLRSIFFIVCFVMGFYGAGMVVFVASFGLCLLRFKVLAMARIILITTLVFFSVYWLTSVISPRTLQYNKSIVNRFLGQENVPVPRKLTSYSNYFKGYTSNIKDLVFGSGPGTFNSRSAFAVGSPDYLKSMQFIKSDRKPYYFQNYAYTLWNASNTIQYQEGFMNQPFSSLLAFMGEYGLLFTLIFIYYYYRQYKGVRGYPASGPAAIVAREMYKFSTIYLMLLLIIDNYVEYPEITILITMIMKLAESLLLQRRAGNESNA